MSILHSDLSRQSLMAADIGGTTGPDTLDGTGIAANMAGGAGDDTYIVDSSDDTVTELSGEGTDLVQTTLGSYTLGANVENLTYTGSGDFAGTGNGSANVLSGAGGNDAFSGAGGNDKLYGYAGNDSLDGGAGNDSMFGGLGDDVYVVNAAGDRVTEAADEGTDTVRTSLSSYTLGADVENLVFTSGSSFTGTGNGLSNALTATLGFATLSGNGGNDTLQGGMSGHNQLSGGDGNDLIIGANFQDTLSGGAGDDTYVIGRTDAPQTLYRMLENAGEGTDTVQTAMAGFSLLTIANVENLTYTGDGNFQGTGNNQANIITGGGGDDGLGGGEGDDTVNGGGGNDDIYGGLGADLLNGGDGDDTYHVEDNLDTIVELAGQGRDTVVATVSCTLPDYVESLVLFVDYAINGTGNDLNNIITGSTNKNLIDGGAGNDTMIGRYGDDTYVVDSAGDVVTEAAFDGNDEVRTALAALSLASNVETLTYTGSGNFAGIGNGQANTLNGGDGDDALNGGAGNDTLNGGAGDDTYYVDSASDSVVEASFAGSDTVIASISYTLSHDVETLTLSGGDINGTGNGLGNVITGSSGNNLIDGGDGSDRLDGGLGSDTLAGGYGDDTFYVNGGDSVVEDANGGRDTVIASASFTLGNNVENLTLNGGDIDGTGNDSGNSLTGSTGNNLLDGGLGDDSLAGGAGNDTYVVDSAGDTIIEAPGDGSDQVRTTLGAYVLGENLESLAYAGGGDFTGSGNAAANSLAGGGGNDKLNGMAGADSLAGGAGNDTYYVDNAGDATVEDGGAGIDLVTTTLTAWTLGDNVENLSFRGTHAFTGSGNASNNAISSGSGNDTLSGGDGNDSLNGMAGNDSMAGGAGNDLYTVDAAGDVVSEAAGEGMDMVRSTLTYSLGINVENLTLTGTAAIDGTGNDGNNKLTGNSADNSLSGGDGNDVLNGGLGADTMTGGDGNDVYYVDNGGDQVTEAAGEGYDAVIATRSYTLGDNVEKLVNGGAGDFTGTGNAGDNVIIGNSNGDTLIGLGGNDALNGGIGDDTMEGGAGNDTYYVDSVYDVVSEDADGGSDTVRAGISYELGDNLENLILTGSDQVDGTGNALANKLTGNSAGNVLEGGDGNDILTGGLGDDSLSGGSGDDIYYVDSSADVVSEADGEGNDTVRATATFALSDHVERLQLIGAGDIDGTGNGEANIIQGNSGDNVLRGLGGNDKLTGGDGGDSFVFEAAAANGLDKISDFASGTDHLVFAIADYGASAGLTLGARAVGPGAQFVYNAANHTLYWDSDGAGGQAAVALAVLSNVTVLQASDLLFE